MLSNLQNLPLASQGLTSYRCRGTYGWIMIGAHDHEDAFREALRSSPNAKRHTLEVWTGSNYESIYKESSNG